MIHSGLVCEGEEREDGNPQSIILTHLFVDFPRIGTVSPADNHVYHATSSAL